MNFKQWPYWLKGWLIFILLGMGPIFFVTMGEYLFGVFPRLGGSDIFKLIIQPFQFLVFFLYFPLYMGIFNLFKLITHVPLYSGTGMSIHVYNTAWIIIAIFISIVGIFFGWLYGKNKKMRAKIKNNSNN